MLETDGPYMAPVPWQTNYAMFLILFGFCMVCSLFLWFLIIPKLLITLLDIFGTFKKSIKYGAHDPLFITEIF